MKDIKNLDAVLDATDPNFADDFAEAIGARPGDTIEIVTPQFEREQGEPAPCGPPESLADWEALTRHPVGVLRELGLRPWAEEGPWLFPKEWYDHIPAGLSVVDINGASELFEPGVTDNDYRFGMLAFGVGRRGDDGTPMEHQP
jgi:hypothetical protein